MRKIIKIKFIAILGPSILFSLSAHAIDPEQAKLSFSGYGVCPDQYRLVTRDEAILIKDELVGRMGPYYATGLADNWVLMGSHYNGEIRQGGYPESSWCYPISPNNSPIPSYPAWILPAGDEVDVQWRMVNNQSLFIKPVSYLADALGYAWVGGNNATSVGEGMNVTKHGDGWLIKGQNSGSCSGYRCDDKSSIKVNNFSYTLEPESFNHGTVTESGKQLVKVISANAINYSSESQQVVVALKYDTASNWSKTDTYNLSEKLTTKNKFKWPLVGETELSVEISSSQSWASQNGGSNTESASIEARPIVPPKSSLPVRVALYKSNISYPYEFKAKINYDLTIDGFLRWGGNAWYTHPQNRPNKTHTFAIGPYRDKASSIQYQWDKRHIPSETQWWDWNWAIRDSGLESMQDILGMVLRPIKSAVTGDFYAEHQFAGDIQIGIPRTISTRAFSNRNEVELTDLDLDQESLAREGFGNVTFTLNLVR